MQYQNQINKKNPNNGPGSGQNLKNILGLKSLINNEVKSEIKKMKNIEYPTCTIIFCFSNLPNNNKTKWRKETGINIAPAIKARIQNKARFISWAACQKQ